MLMPKRGYNWSGIMFCQQTGGPITLTGWAYKREDL